LKDIKKDSLPLVNEEIVFNKLQLIGSSGENIGVVSRETALEMALTAELDLVLMSENGKDGVPVAKIMDFGKALYERKKKLSEAKKKQKVIQIKEIKLRPKIGEHDFQTKMKQAVEFLKDGKHLKITLVFRGREVSAKEEYGSKFFGKIQKSFEAYGIAGSLIQEKDLKLGQFWSRIYYLK